MTASNLLFINNNDGSISTFLARLKKKLDSILGRGLFSTLQECCCAPFWVGFGCTTFSSDSGKK